MITNLGDSTTLSEDDTGAFPIKSIDIEKFDADIADCSMTNNDGCPFDVIGKNKYYLVPFSYLKLAFSKTKLMLCNYNPYVFLP